MRSDSKTPWCAKTRRPLMLILSG